MLKRAADGAAFANSNPDIVGVGRLDIREAVERNLP